MHWIPGGKCNTIFIIFIWVTTPWYGADRNLYRSAYGQPEYMLHTSRLTSVRFSSIKERRLTEGDKEVGLVLFMEISSLLWGRVPQKCWGNLLESVKSDGWHLWAIRGGTRHSNSAWKMVGSGVLVRRAFKVDNQLLLGAIEKKFEEESDVRLMD